MVALGNVDHIRVSDPTIFTSLSLFCVQFAEYLSHKPPASSKDRGNQGWEGGHIQYLENSSSVILFIFQVHNRNVFGSFWAWYKCTAGRNFPTSRQCNNICNLCGYLLEDLFLDPRSPVLKDTQLAAPILKTTGHSPYKYVHISSPILSFR